MALVPMVCLSAQATPEAYAPASLAGTYVELSFVEPGQDASLNEKMGIQFPLYDGTFAVLPENGMPPSASPEDASMPLNITYKAASQASAVISFQNYNTDATLHLYFTTPRSGKAQLVWKKRGSAPFASDAVFELKASPVERVSLMLPKFPFGK